MIEVISVPALLSRPRYWHGAMYDTRSRWARSDNVALKALCEAGAPLTKSGEALGRSETSVAWRASDTGLKLPPEWREAIKPRRVATPKRVDLQYPYIQSVRGEHAQLLAVNALVPRGLPDHMRGDICQEIMLALWQGETTLDELKHDKSAVNRFIREFRKANLEGGGYVLSLDTPMADGRSWYDVLPAPEAE